MKENQNRNLKENSKELLKMENNNNNIVEELKEIQEEEIPKGSAASSEHYMKQEIQSIEVMQMVMSYEKFLGFLEGNIIKYSMRCGLKDDPKQEKTKIKQYKMWLDMARVGKIIDPRVHVYKEEDNKNE